MFCGPAYKDKTFTTCFNKNAAPIKGGTKHIKTHQNTYQLVKDFVYPQFSTGMMIELFFASNKVLYLILKLCYTPALVICRQSMSVTTSRLLKRWLQLEPKTKPQICQTYPQSQVQRSLNKNTPIKIIDSHETILHLLPSDAALW